MVETRGVVCKVFYPKQHDAGATARVLVTTDPERRGATRTGIRGPLLSVAPWYEMHARGTAGERGDVEAEVVTYTRRPIVAADLDEFLRGVNYRIAGTLRKSLTVAGGAPPDLVLAAIDAKLPQMTAAVARTQLGIYARIDELQLLVPRYYTADKMCRLSSHELTVLVATLRTKPHKLCFRTRYPHRWPISELTAAQLRLAHEQFAAPVKPVALRAAELNDRMRDDVKQGGHSYSLRSDVVGERAGYYKKALDYLVAKDIIVVEDNCLYLRRVHARKVAIAAKVRSIVERNAAAPQRTVEEALAAARWARQPSDEQRRAFELVFSNPVSVVAGHPGSGKSTLISAIISLYPGEALVDAFTGRAVDRMRPIVPVDTAHTLHHVALDVETAKREGGPNAQGRYAHVRLVVIDEASMVSASILARFLAAFPLLEHFVIVGDGDQLPPMGYGDVMAAFSAAVPCIKLQENHRASSASAAVARDNIERMTRGLMPRGERTARVTAQWRLPSHPYVIVPRSDSLENDLRGVVRALRAAGVTEDKMQIMTHTNVDVDAGNAVCMREFRGIEMSRGIYSVGDKLCIIKNCPAKAPHSSEVSNGEIGRLELIEDVDAKDVPQARPLSTAVPVRNKCERRITFRSETGGLKQWRLADVPLSVLRHGWVVTVHKMQGSEQDYTVVYVPKVRGTNATRNLLVTATSRQKEQVVVIGDDDDIARIIANPARPRRSNLAARIRAALAGDVPVVAVDEPELWIAADSGDELPEPASAAPVNVVEEGAASSVAADEVEDITEQALAEIEAMPRAAGVPPDLMAASKAAVAKQPGGEAQPATDHKRKHETFDAMLAKYARRGI